MLQRERGFTLLELLIVVAIVGIIAAIAIPNLVTALQRAKQKRTMANMRNIASAWEERATETGRYNAAGLAGADIALPADDVEAALQPTYIKAVPNIDGWGNNMLYFGDRAWGDAELAARYEIVSAGKDGVLASSPAMGAFMGFDCDLIYSNGAFVAYPAPN